LGGAVAAGQGVGDAGAAQRAVKAVEERRLLEDQWPPKPSWCAHRRSRSRLSRGLPPSSQAVRTSMRTCGRTGSTSSSTASVMRRFSAVPRLSVL
jgi:hypothetical protein